MLSEDAQTKLTLVTPPQFSSFIHPIQDRLCLAMCTTRQARKLVIASLKTTWLISGMKHEPRTCIHAGFRPSSLSEIFRFSQRLRTKMLNRIGNTTIIICAGQHAETITNTALALGGFLIMFQQYSADDVQKIFTPILKKCVEYLEHSCSRGTIEDLSLRDCWVALHYARLLNPEPSHQGFCFYSRPQYFTSFLFLVVCYN